MNYFLAIFAGAIQGLTELLPVSSTGHLIVFEKIFRLPQNQFGLSFDASLHLGTLLAILLFFYKDYLKALSFKDNLLVKIIIATIPAALTGIFLEKLVQDQFRQILIVATSLILFSFVIFFAEKYGKKIKKEKELKLMDSLIIGIFQVLALVPGVSRSGSTISAGLFLGMKREEAARFAFLISGPIILGAGLKEFLGVITSGVSSSEINFFIIGIISSAIFGYLTIKYFLRYLSTKTLYPFIIYRVIFGLILLLLASWL